MASPPPEPVVKTTWYLPTRCMALGSWPGFVQAASTHFAVDGAAEANCCKSAAVFHIAVFLPNIVQSQ